MFQSGVLTNDSLAVLLWKLVWLLKVIIKNHLEPLGMLEKFIVSHILELKVAWSLMHRLDRLAFAIKN